MGAQTDANPNITVNVDVTNPGQFFACCGLLELADRLWPGAEAWFTRGVFCVTCAGTFAELLEKITDAELAQVAPDDDMASPMMLSDPFNLRRQLKPENGHEFGADGPPTLVRVFRDKVARRYTREANRWASVTPLTDDEVSAARERRLH